VPTVRDRPQRADGSDADGICIFGLTVRESATPTPSMKNHSSSKTGLDVH
jgi:hypothetical protein